MLVKGRQKSLKISKNKIATVTAIVVVISIVGFFGLNSFKPVNSDTVILASPTNIYLKAVKSAQGYHFSTQSTKGGKMVPTASGNSPALSVAKGNLVQIHIINEEKNEQNSQSKHNLNIDEFNVHTEDLGYFQTGSVIFLADKAGTFEYYCSVHPEMRGTITVT